MVELVEVEDEAFESKQAGPSDNEEDYYTETDSEISSDEEDNTPDLEETFTDRLYALRDIIPPTVRSSISSKVSTTTSWIQSAAIFSGKGLWVLSTSALLLGVPWALAFAEEQQMVEMEREMRMREAGGQLLAQGQEIAGAPQGKPAL